MEEFKNVQQILVMTEAEFERRLERVCQRVIAEQRQQPIWVSEKIAKDLLGVKSSTTMLNFRKNGILEYTMPTPKTIKYKLKSIESYLESKSFKTF